MARSTYDDFLIKEKIGSGSYGVVFKVIRKIDKQTYAMKEIDLQGMTRKEQEECIRETRVLSSLDSDYIIKYYDSFLERGKLYIITEYAANGNLHDYIKKQKSRLSEELIWKLFLQILLGLNHMHSKKILHRDIKTLNVFLDDELNVKLGDMGVAKILSTNTNFAKTIVGTPYYLSPELCEDKPYNEKSDVWALGVVLYECCTQRHPFDADNQGALILKILRGKYPPISGYSPEVQDLIKRCLTQNANRRPNTFKLLTLASLRQKGEELGIILPDLASMQAWADRPMVQKAKARPPSAQPGGVVDSPEAVAVRALPKDMRHQGGVIHVVGSMDSPPQPGEAPSTTAAAAAAGNGDKAFVFGGTMKAAAPRARPVDVTVSEVEATAGHSGGEAQQGGPVQAEWRVAAAGQAGKARPAWGFEADMGNLAIEDDEGGEEDEGANPYLDPRTYRDPNDDGDDDDDGDDEGDDEGEEEDDGYDDDDDGYDNGGAGGDEPSWQPDPTRVQHMRSALMIQRAACLDLVGEKAFNELYSLLKSNQVDEASMTDLSRLVFKIIPYDKSEVIQMMYKLLYLESQLEGTQ